MTKTALIIGISGQDGSYLAEYLLSKRYIVHGTTRIGSNHWRLHNIKNLITLHFCDLKNYDSIDSIIKNIKVDEIYNLGGISDIGTSLKFPELTYKVNAEAVLSILQSINKYNKEARFFQAGSSEMFGYQPAPQSEDTPFDPVGPYAISKVKAFEHVKNYREKFNIFSVNGILFNHDSPRRSPIFVTQKVVGSACKIKYKLEEELALGNIYSTRDWGYAPEYCQIMWRMLQSYTPDDYVIATGEVHSVKDLCDISFRLLDMQIVWEGFGKDTIGLVNGKKVISINKDIYDTSKRKKVLIGNASKAASNLNWKRVYRFYDIVNIMVNHERVKYG